MLRKIAIYKIKEEYEEEILSAVEDYVAAIEDNEENTYYEVNRGDDDLTFIHYMEFDNPKAAEVHKKMEHTVKFREFLYPRCTEEPVFYSLKNFANTI